MLTDAAARAEAEWEERALLPFRIRVVTRRVESQRVGPDVRIAVDAAQVDSRELAAPDSGRHARGGERYAGLLRYPRDAPDCRGQAQRFGKERCCAAGIGAQRSPCMRRAGAVNQR